MYLVQLHTNTLNFCICDIFVMEISMKKIILPVSVIVLIIIFFAPLIKQFTITNKKTNEIVFCDSIDNFKDFYISFIHSVNKTHVNEYYRVDGDKFAVYKTTFYSYGAGMPDVSEIPNASIKFNDGFVEINNIDRRLDEFAYMVGTCAEHTLHGKNDSFKLEKYVEPQETALFKIRRVSIYDILRRRFNE